MVLPQGRGLHVVELFCCSESIASVTLSVVHARGRLVLFATRLPLVQ
jgi:hypothetical protein